MDKPIEYPDFVARFYDAVYNRIRSTTDSQYFIDKMLEAKGTVLEVGVGTGRMFLQALDLGVDVYGIDVNANMLDQLRASLAPEHLHRVALQDLRTLELDREFELIVAPFRVLAHMITVKDQLAALERVARHLAPQGRFIFDLFVPDHRRLAEGLEGVEDFVGEHAPGKKLRRIVSMTNDPVAQVSQVTMRFVWEEEQGRERDESWTFPFRHYFRHELEHLIHRSALELEAIYGDYQEGPLDTESKDFVVICRLPAPVPDPEA